MPDEKVISLLSPTTAISEIIHYAGSELAAKQILIDGLHAGKLRLIAKHVWGTDVGDVQGEWTPRPRKGHVYGEDQEVGPGVFSSSVQWPEELKYWRWDKGEFVVFLSEDEEGWGRFDRLYIQDAYFFRDEVMALVGRSKRGGGPKSDRDRWAMFWINVLWDYTGHSFDWTQYGSPYELKQAFLSANDHEANRPNARGDKTMFAESNIDRAVELAWKHLVMRSARESIKEHLDLR